MLETKLRWLCPAYKDEDENLQTFMHYHNLFNILSISSFTGTYIFLDLSSFQPIFAYSLSYTTTFGCCYNLSYKLQQTDTFVQFHLCTYTQVRVSELLRSPRNCFQPFRLQNTQSGVVVYRRVPNQAPLPEIAIPKSPEQSLASFLHILELQTWECKNYNAQGIRTYLLCYLGSEVLFGGKLKFKRCTELGPLTLFIFCSTAGEDGGL